MKVLFLDDDKNRHVRFLMNNIGLDITYTWTAEEAIKALETTFFEEVSLDHDLGGYSSQLTLPEAGGGSGYDVACFIAELPLEKRPKRVIIHSMNPAGAHRMGMALLKCRAEGMKIIRVPFGS